MAAALVVKAALLNADGQVLVLRRSDRDVRRPGGIDFPGGTAEQGEDVLHAGAREIAEEVGISFSPSELSIIYTHMGEADERADVVVRVLCAARVSKEVEVTLSFEHEAYEWLSLDEAENRFGAHQWGVGLRFARNNSLLP